MKHLHAIRINSTIAALVIALSGSGRSEPIDKEKIKPPTISELDQTTSSKPLWQVDLGRKSLLFTQSEQGGILVVSDSLGAVFIDSDSGKVLWSISDLNSAEEVECVPVPNSTRCCLKRKDKVGSEHEIPGVNATGVSFDVINLETGDKIWNSKQTGLAGITDIEYLPSVHAFLVVGQDESKLTWSAAVSIDAGAVLWKKKDLFHKGDRELVAGLPSGHDTLNSAHAIEIDSATAAAFILNKRYVRRVNLLTGEIVWSTDNKDGEVPEPDQGYADIAFDVEKKLILIPTKNSIMALNYETGEQAWATLPKLRGRPYQIEVVDRGVVVLGGPDLKKTTGRDYMTLLDRSDGSPVWLEDFAELDHGGTSNFVIYHKRAWLFSKRKFWCVDLFDGSSTLLSDTLAFGPDEPVPSVEYRDSAFLLTGANTIARVEKDGYPQFVARFSPPPAKFGLADVFAVALVVAQVAAVSNTPGYHTIYYPRQLPMSGTPEATSLENRYVYVLTNVRDSLDRKPGLAKVNRLTGKAEAAIQLDDRKPEYVSDEEHHRLYYMRDGHTLECYPF